MKMSKRLLSVVLVLVLGLSVALPGPVLYGDESSYPSYNTTDEGVNATSDENEQYVADIIGQDGANDESAPALFGVAQSGGNHFVSNAPGLISALSNATCGDFITLMADITFLHRIHVYNRNITLVTNGFTLYAQPPVRFFF